MKKIILCIVLLILSIVFVVSCTFSPINEDFNRAVYSVVVYNQTDQVLNNISILCGRDIKDLETVAVVGEINDLQPKEFRKINISTSNPPQQADVPYNVSVVLNDFEIYEAAGYFGMETGGLAVVSIFENEGVASLKRIYEHERLYKKVEKRHNRNQNELSWQ